MAKKNSKQFSKAITMLEVNPVEEDERSSFEIMLDNLTDYAEDGDWTFVTEREDEMMIFRLARGFEFVTFKWDLEENEMAEATHSVHLVRLREVYNILA